MKTILLCIFLCSMKFSYASALPALHVEDTTIHKEFKLDKKGFFEKYGCDDSSRALIQFYFNKRNEQKGSFFVGAGLAFVAGVAYFPVNNMPDMVNNGPDFFMTKKDSYFIMLAVLITTAIPFLLSGGCLWMRYSRRRLMKLLNNYSSGKSIPKGISKTAIFRGYLYYGEWNFGIKKMIKSADILKKTTDAYNRKLLRRQARMAE